MKRLGEQFEKLQEIMVMIFLSVMACSSFLQVINRNIFMLPIAWTEELSRYCMIWMTMIGTGISVRKGMQMSINIWGSRLKGKALLTADLISYLFCFGFCGVVMVSVINLFMVQLSSGQKSPAMHIPMCIMTCAIFIGMLFLCLVEVEQI